MHRRLQRGSKLKLFEELDVSFAQQLANQFRYLPVVQLADLNLREPI
jgi:hypothetical protein